MKGVTSRPLPQKRPCRHLQEIANGKVFARNKEKKKKCSLQAVALTLFNRGEKKINIYRQTRRKPQYNTNKLYFR